MSQIGTWHRAAALNDISEDDPLEVEIGSNKIALYRLGEEVFATGNVCTHAYALLSDGLLDGYEIECPLHNGRFDIRTGKALSSPVEVDIPTYPVRIVAGQVEVCLPP